MRKFGIELEMVAPSARGSNDALTFAKDTISAIGIRVRTNSYTGRAYDIWQVKSDGSIQPHDRGAEVVSRILPGNESSYGEITQAVSALSAAGFGVNRSCGFHVHISVADLPVHVRQLVFLRYAQLQGQISAMLPPSRRANGYCEILGEGRRRQLADNVDSGRGSFPSTRGVCNSQHVGSENGDQARIEFRQAGGTVDAAKVIGWVRFLQELIDEVARRAAGVTFGDSRLPTRPARPILPPRPGNPMASVPRMRDGSDADRALTQLCTTGIVTAAWATEQGIAEPVLRRIIVGFRRHGADIETNRNPLMYSLNGIRTLPVARGEVFASQTVAAAPVPAPVPPQPAIPATVRAGNFVRYPFNAGLSTATLAWVRERCDTFNADASHLDIIDRAAD